MGHLSETNIVLHTVRMKCEGERCRGREHKVVKETLHIPR
jgi:hypothetical protein